MTTRCKDGGFAIIEHDVDSCAANIGRIVRVKAPAVIDKAGHLTWLIQPVGDEPYMVCNHAGEFDGFMVFGNNNIEHQDGWMRPISECDVEFEGISRASESVPGFGQVSRLGQHERQYGVSFFLKHTYVAPRPHYLVRKLSGRTRTDRLVQFLARVWGDLLFQLETPIKVSETAYWRFVVVLGCIRFAINRHGGQIDIQEQVWHEGVLRFATTLEKYAIDLPLRLTGFWLKTYLVRWQEKIQDCLIDQADSEVFEKAVIVELQRSVRLSAHWRRVRHQLRDALGLDRELLRILKINQCIPYTLHPTYNRYAPQGVAIRRAIQENPHLAWLVFCTGNTSGRKMPSSSDPIAWVKEEIARAGVTNAAWRYLTRCRREDFLPILERPLQSRWGLLVNWLKVVGMLRRNDPVPVQILRWLYNTVRVSEGKLWFNGVRVQVGSLRSILGTAEQRLAANRLDEFMGGDLVDVLTWLKVVKPRLDPNQIRRGWAHLARQAAIWKEDVTMSEQNATRWVSLLPRTEIDGYQVTALTSFYQLWREGVSLRHCIGDAQYRRRCEEGAMCIFSISRADRKVATLSLACPDGAWVVHDIRGFANQAVGKPLAALGETVAASYNAMKKMNESSNAEQAVAPPMSTPGEEQ